MAEATWGAAHDVWPARPIIFAKPSGRLRRSSGMQSSNDQAKLWRALRLPSGVRLPSALAAKHGFRIVD